MSSSPQNQNLITRIAPSESPFHDLSIDPARVDMHGGRPLAAGSSLLADEGAGNSRAFISMSDGCGGPGAASSEGLSGEGGSGSAEWRRIYDRIVALLPRVEKLAADRARLEVLNRTQRDLSGARENELHARLVQAEASRARWKKAYIDLPLLANPKIIELQENDLEDSRKREALFDVDSSRSEMQLKGGRRHVDPNENNVDYEDIARDLRAELTKLKQAYETLSASKDKEANEAAQKFQQNIEELQVAVRRNASEIGRLRAEAVDAENKLREVRKDNTALLKIREVEGAQATEATHKLQKNVEDLQVAARNNDDEICRLRAEALTLKNKLLVAEGKLDEMHSLAKEKNIHKVKDGQLESLKRKRASLPSESIQIFVDILDEKIPLKVKTSDTIDIVMAMIQDKTGLRPCEQLLSYVGGRLNDRCTLADYYIQKKSTIKVFPLRDYIYVIMPSTSNPGKIINLMGDPFWKRLSILVDRSDTIANIKAKIQVKEGIPTSRQDLWHWEKLLENNRTLDDYNIRSGSCLCRRLVRR